jgi:hypothetical protein
MSVIREGRPLGAKRCAAGHGRRFCQHLGGLDVARVQAAAAPLPLPAAGRLLAAMSAFVTLGCRVVRRPAQRHKCRHGNTRLPCSCVACNPTPRTSSTPARPPLPRHPRADSQAAAHLLRQVDLHLRGRQGHLLHELQVRVAAKDTRGGRAWPVLPSAAWLPGGGAHGHAGVAGTAGCCSGLSVPAPR